MKLDPALEKAARAYCGRENPCPGEACMVCAGRAQKVIDAFIEARTQSLPQEVRECVEKLEHSRVSFCVHAARLLRESALVKEQ